MADTTLRLFVLYDGTEADEGMVRTAGIADEAANKMGASGVKAGEKFASGIDSGTTKVGGAFEKLGNSLGNWGLPFSENLEKIGKDLDNVTTRGKGVREAMSALGGVTVAAGIGIAAESIHISDQFETAQSNLDTAIKNSGNSVGAFKSQIDAAYSSAAKLGFENTDVAEGLQTLVTATQSPTKALNDLSTAENIARLRHESLSDASAQLAKILGGNTRLLQQWGINLDIGTGKLHSIQSAEESVQKAQLNLNTVQAEITSGQKTGAEASGALASAQLTLRNAQLGLTQDQQAIPDILDAINQRTRNVASNYGKTLPGQMKIAEAEVHNLGVAFGEYLVPKIDALLGDGAKLVNWFEQNKAPAEVLAGVIGVTLSSAVAVFTFNRLVSLGTGLVNMGKTFGSLATTVAEKTGIINAQAKAEAVQEAQTASAIEQSQAAIRDAWDTTQTAISAIETEQQSALEKLGVSFEGLGTSAESGAAAAESAMDTLAADVATSDAAIESANETAAASFTAMLGPIGLVAAAAVAAHGKIESLVNSVSNSVFGTANNTSQFQSQVNSDYAKDHGNAKDMAELRQFVAQEDKSFGFTASVPSGSAAAALLPSSQLGYSPASGTVAGLLNPASKSGVATPGSTIPNLGGVPAVSAAGGTANTALTPAEVAMENAALNMAGGIKGASSGGTSLSQQGSTISKLDTELTATHKAALEQMVAGLEATHNATLTRLATTLETDWEAAQTKLATIIDGDIKAGQSKIGTLQSAIESASATTLRSNLQGIHKTELEELVHELRDAHSAAATQMANQVTSVYKQAQAALNTQLESQYRTSLADEIEKRAQETTAVTTAAQNAATAAVDVITQSATKQDDAIQAAATSITDASKILQDAAAAQVQGIQDQTTSITDAANAQATATADQAQTTADTVGERGLYGLALVAQQDKVALDIQKQGDDQRISAAQAHLDQVTAHQNQLVATAQMREDQATQSSDIATAAAQQTADTQAINSTLSVAAAQAKSDAVGITTAINDAAAQAHVDASQWGSTLSQNSAQAAEKLVTAQGDAAQATANASLAAATATANTLNANAQAAYSLAQANASQQSAQAQAALAAAQATASIQIATAQGQLSAVQAAATVAEATLSATQTVATALASTQFAGSGMNVYITGLPMNDAAAISSELSYVGRSMFTAPVSGA